MRKTLICTISLLTACCCKTLAQQTRDSMYVGKTTTDEEFDNMKKRAAQKNAAFIGRKYTPFRAQDINGHTVTLDSLKGKVCVLVFWYPSCGCYDLAQLKELTDRFKDNLNFRLMIVTFETTGLAAYMTAHNIDFPVAVVRYMNDAQEMNFHNGFPSFVLLNKAGVVTRVNGLNALSLPEYTDMITHLL